MPKKGKSKPKVDKSSFLSYEEAPEDREAFLDAVKKLDPRQGKHADFMEEDGRFRKSPQDNKTIDLHGFTVAGAIDRVDEVLTGFLGAKEGPTTCRFVVVTGKGLNSPGGEGVLFREIPRYITNSYSDVIVWSEQLPDTTVVDRVPTRGHFEFIVRRRP